MWKRLTGLLLLGMMVGCMPDAYDQQVATGLEFKQQAFSQQDGPCGAAGDPACVTLSISYPEAEGGGAVGDSINAFLRSYLAEVLSSMMPGSEGHSKVERLADQLISDYQHYREDFPNTNVPWHMEIRGNVLHMGSQFLTLNIHHQEQLGEGMAEGWSRLLTFDLAKGQLIPSSELIPNTEGFASLAEKYFRMTTGMLPGEDFTQRGYTQFSKGFRLPENMGKTDDSLLLTYNPHELGADIQQEIAFSIPFSELLPTEVAKGVSP